MSPRFTLTKANLPTITRHFLFGAAATVVVYIISFLGNTEVPDKYVFLMPILIAGLRALSQFLNTQN